MSTQEKPYLITVPTLTTLEIMAKSGEEALSMARNVNGSELVNCSITALEIDYDRLEDRFETEQDFNLEEDDLDIPEDLIFDNEDYNRIVRQLIRIEMPTEKDPDSDDIEYLRRYSGRAMYGSYCPAIVTDDIGRTLAKVGQFLGRLSVSIDSLGLQSVVYFR